MKPHRQSLKSPFVVCITGASRGIGAETAKAFAEAGATGLVLTARTESALQRTHEACEAAATFKGLKTSIVAGDAGSVESAQRIARVIEEEHGRLDVLVNNAGVMCFNPSAFGKLDAMEDEDFQDVMDINCIGRFRMIKHLIPIMMQSPDGAKAVINITSLSSHLVSGTPIGFNISEFATNRLTEAVADMYKEDGVLAYAVHPGMVATTPPPGFPDMFKQFAVDDPGLCGAFLVWLVKEKRQWLSGRYMSSNWDVMELEELKEQIVREDKLTMRMVV